MRLNGFHFCLNNGTLIEYTGLSEWNSWLWIEGHHTLNAIFMLSHHEHDQKCVTQFWNAIFFSFIWIAPWCCSALDALNNVFCHFVTIMFNYSCLLAIAIFLFLQIVIAWNVITNNKRKVLCLCIYVCLQALCVLMISKFKFILIVISLEDIWWYHQHCLLLVLIWNFLLILVNQFPFCNFQLFWALALFFYWTSWDLVSRNTICI